MAIKYKQIASALREQILSARSMVSYKLPTEKELCSTYNVSRQTIRQALDVLTREGLIHSKQGSGIYTIPLPSHTDGKVVLLISEKEEYTYPSFLSSLRSLLSARNITPDIRTTDHDYNTEREILTSLIKQPPVILVIEGIRDAFDNPNLDLYEQLMIQQVSIVFINSGYSALPEAYRISSDDYTGAYLLGEHLIVAGLYQVSCILPDYASNAKTRYQGLLAAYRDHSLPMPSNEIFWYNWEDVKQLRLKQNTRFLHSFIHSHKKGGAVFCYNDEIAYHLIKEFEYAKISVPGDVAVISFDNSYLSRISSPPLTTLSLEEHSLETKLTELIHTLLGKYITDSSAYRMPNMGQINTSYNGNIPPHTQTLPWKLISRNSVPTS